MGIDDISRSFAIQCDYIAEYDYFRVTLDGWGTHPCLPEDLEEYLISLVHIYCRAANR